MLESLFNKVAGQSKIMGQSKESKLNLTGPRIFDISFGIIFTWFDQSFISARENGH